MQFAAKAELNWFVQGIRIFLAWLCGIMYEIISYLYNLFMNLTKINLLNEETIKPIYQRITLILTIVMVFYVTFQFVKYVVQPDTMTDKEKGAGNIVFKMIAVVVLIAFVPKFFTAALNVQNAIIEKNVIGKVILGQNSEINKNLGGTFSYKMLEMFYSLPEEYAEKDCEDVPCTALMVMNQKALIENGELPYMTVGINAAESKTIATNSGTKKIVTPYIKFDGLKAVIFGGFIIYMLLLYCIDVGVRWAQLVYLQIIAPIPIIGYLSPKKDGIFQKWCKQCLTTYLDIFLRIAIINLVLFITSLLLNTDTDYIFENVKNESDTMKSFINIALIMGLLLFAHKAPKMLSELFPKSSAASGNFGLKATERVAPEVARVAGAALGSTRMLGGAVSRAVNRHARNKANGAHSILTAEGREQRRERSRHRQQAAQMESDLSLTEAAHRGHQKVTDADVAKSKERVMRAVERRNNATTNEEREEAERELNSATAAHRNLMQKRNNVGRFNQGASNQLNEDLKNANDKYMAAKRAHDAIPDSNREAKNAAKARMDEAKLDFDKQMRRFKDIRSGNIEKARDNYVDARSQVAKDNNEKHQSIIGGVVSGAASGLYTGAKEGFKAKKLEEIVPKAQEGWKKDIKHEQELNKYIDNGGAVGLQGTIDRTITGLEKSIGIETDYVRTQMSTKPLETQIKEYDAKMTLTKDVSSTVGSAEDRLNSKIYDLKNTTSNSIKTGLKDANGNDIKVRLGNNQTFGDVAREYDAKATLAQNTAAEAAKRLETAKNNGADAATISQLQVDAENKAKEAENAKYMASQIKKNIAREAYSQILESIIRNDPNNLPENRADFDQAAVQNARDALESIKLAASDPDLCEKVKILLNNPHLYNAFITGNITTYDEIDKIKTAIGNAEKVYLRDKKDLQERKRKIETNESAQAQKAANDYNGSGK